MIDRCDSDIASWAEDGENFIVKDCQKFAAVSDNSLKGKTYAFSDIKMCFAVCTTEIFQALQLFEFCSSAELLWVQEASNGSDIDLGRRSSNLMLGKILSR